MSDYLEIISLNGKSVGERHSFGCIMGDKKLIINFNFKFHLFFENICLKGETLKEYLAFLHECTFKFDVDILEDKIIITFYSKDYINDSHFLAAFTCLRHLIFYNKGFQNSRYSNDIVSNSLMLFNKYKDKINEFEALQLAQYYSIDAYSDGTHNLFKEPSKLISKKEFLTNIAAINVLNTSFFKEQISFNWIDLHDKLHSDFESTLNLLK
jgi:hypothetical protein